MKVTDELLHERKKNYFWGVDCFRLLAFYDLLPYPFFIDMYTRELGILRDGISSVLIRSIEGQNGPTQSATLIEN